MGRMGKKKYLPLSAGKSGKTGTGLAARKKISDFLGKFFRARARALARRRTARKIPCCEKKFFFRSESANRSESPGKLIRTNSEGGKTNFPES
jgi:hypothetical protein